jgi:hypothetical protein
MNNEQEAPPEEANFLDNGINKDAKPSCNVEFSLK